jgi:site-specific DNA-methyltransferase (adenine-specific)
MNPYSQNKVLGTSKDSLISDIYLMDCIEGMKQYPDKYFDLCISDPPFGINIEQRVFKDGKKWDTKTPSKEYFNEMFRVSKNQIVWGGNYFIENLYSTKCFLIWDKKITDSHTFSMAEMAWTSFDSNSKCFYQPPPGDRGFYNIDGKRIHPTQKSIDLYKWQISMFCKKGNKIIDPFLGSGSSRIAAYDLNFDFTGFELDPEYIEKSTIRFNNHINQLTLF